VLKARRALIRMMCLHTELEWREGDGVLCGLVIELTSSRYLNVRFGMVWTDLKDLQVPLRVGDVVILPGTLTSTFILHLSFNSEQRADGQ